MDEEAATLESQFFEFSRLMDTKRDGLTITLYRSDYWLRQCKVIDDRKVTMTDTGIIWWKFCKSELNFAEWQEFMADFCEYKNLDKELLEETMTNCGLPSSITIPRYRDFFDTYQPKEKTPF